VIAAALTLLLASGRVLGTTRSADGVEIHYEARGSGKTALVFVHCWSCDRHLWDGQLETFAGDYRVVTLDLAGHGESGRDRKAWTIEAFGDDVAAVAQRLELEHVILVGHSMGGSVILEAARRLPGRVVGLVPVDTLQNVESKNTPDEIDGFLAPLSADYKSAVAKFIRDFMFVPTSDPKLIESIVVQAQAAPPEIAIAALRSTFSYDAASAFHSIKVPIHAINGDKFPTNVEANRRHAPQYRLTLMKGVGHYLMLERPEEFDRLLRETLGSLLAEPKPKKR
jgi:pimeloyl-ACP methyl ester carboxylesterase